MRNSTTPASDSHFGAEITSPYLADVLIAEAARGPMVIRRLPTIESCIEDCDVAHSLGPYLKFVANTRHPYSAMLRQYKPGPPVADTGQRPHVGLLSNFLLYALHVLEGLASYNIIVPIPARAHEDRRHYHLTEIVTHLSSALEHNSLGERFQVRPDILKFVQDVPPVKALPLHKRAAALSYAMSSDTSIRRGSVLIVDDILASGSTVTEATRALRNAGAKHVACLTLAKRVI